MKSLIPLILMLGLMYVGVLWLKSKAGPRKGKSRKAPDAANREAQILAEAKAQLGKKTDPIGNKTLAAGERWPVKQKRTLLTNSEKQMFDRLQDALYEHDLTDLSVQVDRRLLD